MKRNEVYALIDSERAYQDAKWPQGSPPLSPSDEIRLIRKVLADADAGWYATPDEIHNGHRINASDLEMIRKIAGIATRCLETWGGTPRVKGETN